MQQQQQQMQQQQQQPMQQQQQQMQQQQQHSYWNALKQTRGSHNNASTSCAQYTHKIHTQTHAQRRCVNVCVSVSVFFLCVHVHVLCVSDCLCL